MFCGSWPAVGSSELDSAGALDAVWHLWEKTGPGEAQGWTLVGQHGQSEGKDWLWRKLTMKRMITSTSVSSRKGARKDGRRHSPAPLPQQVLLRLWQWRLRPGCRWGRRTSCRLQPSRVAETARPEPDACTCGSGGHTFVGTRGASRSRLRAELSPHAFPWILRFSITGNNLLVDNLTDPGRLCSVCASRAGVRRAV